MAARAGALTPPPLLPLPPRPHLNPRGPSLRARAPRLAVARAASGGGNGDGGPPGPAEEEKEQLGPAEREGEQEQPGPPEGEKEQERRRGPALPLLSEIRWGELLSPEPANAGAVVLTGVLAWAGGSLLLQLALISASIVAAAVKYSFIAAILIFLLIALL